MCLTLANTQRSRDSIAITLSDQRIQLVHECVNEKKNRSNVSLLDAIDQGTAAGLGKRTQTAPFRTRAFLVSGMAEIPPLADDKSISPVAWKAVLVGEVCGRKGTSPDLQLRLVGPTVLKAFI